MNTTRTIVIIYFGLFVPWFSYGAENQGRMKPQTADKLRQKITEKSGKIYRPPFETFVVEDNSGVEVPIESVPKAVLRESERWMRELVRSEWLPMNVSGLLRARKDAFVRDMPVPTGYPARKELGDFLILDYEIKAHRFLLMESGRTLTARIQFPDSKNLSTITNKEALKLISRYFTLPEDAIRPAEIVADDDDQVRSFRWVNGPNTKDIDRKLTTGERLEWWYRLHFYFDGQTLLISIPEIPHPLQLVSQMGLPNRF
jgi:hypothetical protein